MDPKEKRYSFDKESEFTPEQEAEEARLEKEDRERRRSWEQARMDEDKATDKLAEDLSRWVNRAQDKDIQRLSEAILRDHRTLQQKTFGVMLTTIKAWSELPETHYDGRNAATVEKCKAIVKHLGEYGLGLPCI